MNRNKFGWADHNKIFHADIHGKDHLVAWRNKWLRHNLSGNLCCSQCLVMRAFSWGVLFGLPGRWKYIFSMKSLLQPVPRYESLQLGPFSWFARMLLLVGRSFFSWKLCHRISFMHNMGSVMKRRCEVCCFPWKGRSQKTVPHEGPNPFHRLVTKGVRVRNPLPIAHWSNTSGKEVLSEDFARSWD